MLEVQDYVLLIVLAVSDCKMKFFWELIAGIVEFVILYLRSDLLI